MNAAMPLAGSHAVVTGGVARIPTGTVPAGIAQLYVRASDHQESRNMENVGPILPNTRVLRARVTIVPR